MEGEPKSKSKSKWVQGEIGGSSDRRNRVNKKLHGSRMHRGTDASQGGSKPHHKRVKKERLPWVQRGIDASQGEMGGGFQHHQIKCKRVKKKRASRVQRGGSVHNKVNKEWMARVQRAIDASDEDMDAGFESCPFFWRPMNKSVDPIFVEVRKAKDRRYAKKAMEFYEKSQDDEFEILEVLYSERSRLLNPESKSDQAWCHVSFIAKPKNADCTDVSPKHFFGELLESDCSSKCNATYCCTFEPSDDPGFNHGCILCPAGQKFHPANGYHVGRPPWIQAGFVWI
ncbi:uncharacterized protein [Euphorbia lathyris]|uniref:uncharacterized protein n=1 Tax=Euphorbia lathyris TaxID=212925 RepID=UPI0033139236